jgi:uncharacterized protein (DUF608 family)
VGDTVTAAEQTCWLCGRPATLEQVGRCVYAAPCGHRYQGRLEAAEHVRELVKEVRRLFPRYVTTTDPTTGIKRVVRQGAQS